MKCKHPPSGVIPVIAPFTSGAIGGYWCTSCGSLLTISRTGYRFATKMRWRKPKGKK